MKVFTGIVEDVGTVASVSPLRAGTGGHGGNDLADGDDCGGGLPSPSRGLSDRDAEGSGDVHRGRLEGDALEDDAGGMRPGAKVNLERALTLSGRLGGISSTATWTGPARSARSAAGGSPGIPYPGRSFYNEVHGLQGGGDRRRRQPPRSAPSAGTVSSWPSSRPPSNERPWGPSGSGSGSTSKPTSSGSTSSRARRGGGGVTLDFLKDHGYS